jgi:hypothetical protein
MNYEYYKLGIYHINKIKEGNYNGFRLKVPMDEMLTVYNRCILDGLAPKIINLEPAIKLELKKWAAEIGFGENVLLGVNICKVLSILHIDFEQFKK